MVVVDPAVARAVSYARGRLAGLPYRRDVRAVCVLVLAAFAGREAMVRHHGLSEPHAVVLALAATLPLLLGRRFPSLACGLPVAGGAVFIVAARLAWPATAVAAWLVALALSPLRLSRRRAYALLAMAEAAALTAVFVPESINATPWDASVTEVLAAAIAWWFGESVRVRRLGLAERARVEQRLASFAERDAVARERARIARELHDVVAHHVSTIAVRSAMLPYEIDDLSPRARAALAEIAQDARAALTDLRAVLGVLRSGESVSEGAPLPQLADLPALVARVRGGGTPVAFTIEGGERTLADGVQVCGFRIVQEALTNAVRHAPGSSVQVQLVYGPEELTVAVRNDGGGHRLRQSGPAGGGYGLIGMRERVAMLGGRLNVGPQPAGGFEVVAVLPTLGYEGAQL